MRSPGSVRSSGEGVSSTFCLCAGPSGAPSLWFHRTLPHVRIGSLENLQVHSAQHRLSPGNHHVISAIITWSAAMRSPMPPASHSFPIRIFQAFMPPRFLQDFPFFETRLPLPASGAHFITELVSGLVVRCRAERCG